MRRLIGDRKRTIMLARLPQVTPRGRSAADWYTLLEQPTSRRHRRNIHLGRRSNIGGAVQEGTLEPTFRGEMDRG